MLKVLLAAAAALPLAACATVPALTADELAQCQQMQRQMGTAQSHDHAEAKGMGASAMNMNHQHCRQMLDKS